MELGLDRKRVLTRERWGGIADPDQVDPSPKRDYGRLGLCCHRARLCCPFHLVDSPCQTKCLPSWREDLDVDVSTRVPPPLPANVFSITRRVAAVATLLSSSKKSE